jgi:hypothetical protein
MLHEKRQKGENITTGYILGKNCNERFPEPNKLLKVVILNMFDLEIFHLTSNATFDIPLFNAD